MSRSIGDGITHNISVNDIPDVLEFDVEKIKPIALVVASYGVLEWLMIDVKNEVSNFYIVEIVILVLRVFVKK